MFFDPPDTAPHGDEPGPKAPVKDAPPPRRAHPRFRRQVREVMTTPTIAMLSAALAALAFGLSGPPVLRKRPEPRAGLRAAPCGCEDGPGGV
ncbi:hypothetical protein GCM10009546_11250 [Actinomadura livida]|uniref:Uncharacterized protein n=1 Tax=Actinomadura livida TaxID=79909 RepID=A0A7W7N101_9ACTN|nr:hypothetical protein [Actinomadura catellatispora]GGU38065.1 hypothetical protein GCM10010208_73100 [Actinomadura livida]